ncbi:restriction endonuclease [Microbacterium sp. Mu-80]|uniref:Restriction endonuclease n=1 Tax=Microbacterium bandirmense TaxID=3122050 RepID=A0ABU8LDZ7_9MICO
MIDLDPEDDEWARGFGAYFGCWLPDPHTYARHTSEPFIELASAALNKVALAHTRRRYRLTPEQTVSEEQIEDDGPYLYALAYTALVEAQFAVWWRNEKINEWYGLPERKRKGTPPDPGVLYLEVCDDPALREILTGFALPSPGHLQIRDVLGELVELPYDEADAEIEAWHDAMDTARSLVPEREDDWADPLSLLEEYSAALAAKKQQPDADATLRTHPKPAPQPYGVSHEGAELLVADWMRHLDELDSTVTRFSGDGGVDVESARFVAQVKNLNRRSTVEFRDIRDLHGVASVRSKGGLLFTSAGVTEQGLQFAAAAGIALFRYDAVNGTLSGLNELARDAIAKGLPEAFSFS